MEAWEDRGGAGARDFRIYGSTLEHPSDATIFSGATACPRIGIYEILNGGNAWQQTIIDLSFLFSTIDVTFTDSRMVFVVRYPDCPYLHVDFAVYCCVVFSCRPGVLCSLDLLCFSAIDRDLVG